MTVEVLIQDTLKESFEHFKKQFVALILGTIIAFIGSILIITAPPLMFGLYVLAQKVVKGEKAQATDVLKGFDYFVTSWVMTIIALILICIGLLCLVLPGLLLIILFQYAVAVAVTEKLGAVDSLKKSYELAKDNLAYSIVLFIFLAIIGVIGGAIRIGTFITCPYTVLATLIAAQKLAATVHKKHK